MNLGVIFVDIQFQMGHNFDDFSNTQVALLIFLYFNIHWYNIGLIHKVSSNFMGWKFFWPIALVYKYLVYVYNTFEVIFYLINVGDCWLTLNSSNKVKLYSARNDWRKYIYGIKMLETNYTMRQIGWRPLAHTFETG